jgi:hypothetical protein
MSIKVNGNNVDVLIEQVNEFQFIKEDFNDKKYWILEGIFLQADIKNQNNRIYPIEVMRNEVLRYGKQMIEDNRAVGELGHPQDAIINPERISHRIIYLADEDGQGKNYHGKARVSNSPYGKIVQTFLEEETKMGVSSRALGSIRKLSNGINQVQSDFFLATAADIVMNPSAPDAFVRGIMENKEYLLIDGVITEANTEQWKNEIKHASLNRLREVELNTFQNFIDKLDNKFSF